MRVVDGGVPVDVLIGKVKEAVLLAGVSGSSGDLRVASVQLILELVATEAGGAGLEFRVPLIGMELGLSGRVGKRNTHTVDITLVPRERPAPRAVQAVDVEQALVDAISTIRDAMSSAAIGEDPWDISAGTVDISFGVTKSGNISVGAEGELTSEITHTLRLSLVPGEGRAGVVQGGTPAA